MTDIIDRAQELEQKHRDSAIAVARAVRPGRSYCECGTEISELRRSYGARFCIPHTQEHEARERLIRKAI